MQSKQLKLIHVAILLGLFVFAFSTYSIASQKDGLLKIYFLDVGQGDAMFMETPAGSQILIDGGPDRSVIRELGKVMPFYDRSVDMVISTHPDSDHVAGLIEILKRYEVSKILETGMKCDTPYCKAWDDFKNKENVEIFSASLGDTIFTEDGLKIEILSPFESIDGKEFSKRNNEGLVFKVSYGDQSILFAADIESPIEKKLVLSKTSLDSDFLKIAHHGSKTSSTEEFLRAVSPIAAFIEVGRDNFYGHPSNEVTSRLENFSIPYYRTDIDGRIKLTLDGSNYKIYKNGKN